MNSLSTCCWPLLNGRPPSLLAGGDGRSGEPSLMLLASLLLAGTPPAVAEALLAGLLRPNKPAAATSRQVCAHLGHCSRDVRRAGCCRKLSCLSWSRHACRAPAWPLVLPLLLLPGAGAVLGRLLLSAVVQRLANMPRCWWLPRLRCGPQPLTLPGRSPEGPVSQPPVGCCCCMVSIVPCVGLLSDKRQNLWREYGRPCKLQLCCEQGRCSSAASSSSSAASGMVSSWGCRGVSPPAGLMFVL